MIRELFLSFVVCTLASAPCTTQEVSPCGAFRVEATPFEDVGEPVRSLIVEGGNYGHKKWSMQWSDVGKKGRVFAAQYGGGMDSRTVLIVLDHTRSYATIRGYHDTDYGCFPITTLAGTKVYADENELRFLISCKHGGASKPELWHGRISLKTETVPPRPGQRAEKDRTPSKR